MIILFSAGNHINRNHIDNINKDLAIEVSVCVKAYINLLKHETGMILDLRITIEKILPSA